MDEKVHVPGTGFGEGIHDKNVFQPLISGHISDEKNVFEPPVSGKASDEKLAHKMLAHHRSW